jgi:hypothetical protein
MRTSELAIGLLVVVTLFAAYRWRGVRGIWLGASLVLLAFVAAFAWFNLVSPRGGLPAWAKTVIALIAMPILTLWPFSLVAGITVFLLRRFGPRHWARLLCLGGACAFAALTFVALSWVFGALGAVSWSREEVVSIIPPSFLMGIFAGVQWFIITGAFYALAVFLSRPTARVEGAAVSQTPSDD